MKGWGRGARPKKKNPAPLKKGMPIFFFFFGLAPPPPPLPYASPAESRELEPFVLRTRPNAQGSRVFFL